MFGGNTIGVVLSGSGSDGTDAVQTIKKHGGTVIVLDPRSSEHVGMPSAAISTGAVDYVLPLDQIASAVVRLARRLASEPSDGDLPPTMTASK